jgi:hypothetical protein
MRDGTHLVHVWRVYDATMELCRLRAFVHVAQAGTFTRVELETPAFRHQANVSTHGREALAWDEVRSSRR